ncbi:hypothetical protein BLGI_127 [Brevibacillus laterosporus GI-9]|nr:hypothetical protein BLGI_127 [Brevibacillus laterosporus GI-9]
MLVIFLVLLLRNIRVGQMLQRKFFLKKQVCKQKILYALSVMIHKSLINSSEQSFGKKFNKKNLI